MSKFPHHTKFVCFGLAPRKNKDTVLANHLLTATDNSVVHAGAFLFHFLPACIECKKQLLLVCSMH